MNHSFFLFFFSLVFLVSSCVFDTTGLRDKHTGNNSNNVNNANNVNNTNNSNNVNNTNNLNNINNINNTNNTNNVDPCGNGILDLYEECDGTNLGNQTCESFGFHPGGELACREDCTLDLSRCHEFGFCGDGVLQPLAEECDGTDFGEKTCEHFGYRASGELACLPLCILDLSGCVPLEICDNGVDDNDDGLVDCADPDCAGVPHCQSEDTLEFCSDGIDNDGDGLVDCFDPGCYGFCPLSIYELFPANGFDLSLRSMVFSPKSGTWGYDWALFTISSFPESYGTGHGTHQRLNFGYNTGAWITLPFDFPFFGLSKNSIYIQSNLYMTFDTEVNEPIESASAFLEGPPRISIFWDEYDTRTTDTSDDFHLNMYEDRMVLTMPSVWDFFNRIVRVQVILRQNGFIEFHFLSCNNGNGLVGITPGLNSLNTGSVNFQ